MRSILKSFRACMASHPKHKVGIPMLTYYIHDDLRLRFSRESERKRSFKNWPVSSLKPDQMAKAGFFYLDEGNDTVQCAFCGVQIGCWEREHVPMLEHKRYSPSCRFVKSLPCGNIPDSFIDKNSLVDETCFSTVESDDLIQL